MNDYLSTKIKILSFVSIIFVLYIHSGFHNCEIEGMNVCNTVQIIISGKVSRCAVPLFYMISGYLFFLNTEYGMSSIYKKMYKRIGTLLIPYLIGCVFFISFITVIEILPGTSVFFNNSILPLFKESSLIIVKSVFFDAGNGSPCAFQLWFLRDLIEIVIVSPILYKIYRINKLMLLIIIICGMALPIKMFPFHSLFWFALGGILTKENVCMPIKCGRWNMLLFILLSIMEMILYDNPLWSFLQIPIILNGIIGIWYLYDVLVNKDFVFEEHKLLFKMCQYTFFIYLFHEPTLNIIRKLIVFGIGKNELGYTVSYLLSPWLFVCFAIPIAIFIQSRYSRLYKLLTGNR